MGTPIKVKMITAKNCKLCVQAENLVTEAAKAEGVQVEVVELPSDGEAAKKLALVYNLRKVPSFVIKGWSFEGALHSVAKVREALAFGRS